jgi:hypothetical protein
MKIFAKPLLSWKEPPFFVMQFRDRKGWALRLLFAIVIFAVMLFGFYADRKWGQGPAKRWSLACSCSHSCAASSSCD